MNKFKVGDEVWDLYSKKEYKVIRVEQNFFIIQPLIKSTMMFEVPITTKDIIPLAIYNSPLYNALRETKGR